jgi:hypothetical protein
MINGQELRTKLEELIPGCALDEDNEGQVIIYTGLRETEDDQYVAIEREE